VSIASGASMAYPAGWRILRGDRGTATAGLLATDGRFLGYLNVTPRLGGETRAGWPAFRAAHNAREGDTAVRIEASAAGLRFRSGTGSCVRDSYSTITRVRYVEIACLVGGGHAAAVIVGAATPEAWRSTGPMIERAISAFS
jgi:hypothetical protein